LSEQPILREAMPGWKRDAGRRLDAHRTYLPDVRKAERRNPPFGFDGQGWFLSYHRFRMYIKVTFIRGTPVGSMDPEALPPTSTRTRSSTSRA
jgi:hypothetical protein